CVVERSLMRELAERSEQAGVFATIGGVLGDVPGAPPAGPIAKPGGGAAPPAGRDAAPRDNPGSRAPGDQIGALLGALGAGWARAGAERVVAAMPGESGMGPRELVLELCTGRRAPGVRHWRGSEAPERPVLPLGSAERLLRDLAALREDA